MTKLARKLYLADYFALAFGVMVGTAWLVVMDDILLRGGPLGAILGFTAGALMLMPIAYVYSQLIPAIPDSGGEAAYVGKFFPSGAAFATGWFVILSYFLTCPFEAMAAGRISGYLFPRLNSFELYRLGGHPVYLPHLILGLLIIGAITWMNYRGIEISARFGKWTTFTFLTLVAIFALAGASYGRTENFRPLFSRSPLISVLLVWQVVPWLLGGFESVGKCAEEAGPGFKDRNFSLAMVLTIFAGLMFFWVVISVVAFVAPWATLQNGQEFPTALVFERALHAHWIVALVMGAALVSSVQAFNGNMITSSRLLFAMGRSNLVNHGMGYVHPANRTPATAVIAIGAVSALCMLLGEAGLVPILEVGAGTSAIAWFAGCAAYLKMHPALVGRVAALFGLLVTSLMILVKVVPFVPGHFSRYEWAALAIWTGIGLLLRHSRSREAAQSANEIAVAGETL